jgi:hypothetical protein
MDNFHIEEFKNYKVFLYGFTDEDNAIEASIHIKLSNAMGILKFCKGTVPKNYSEMQGTRKVLNLHFRANRYMQFIDILRYERPLFFYYNKETNVGFITTSDEPVGEGNEDRTL